MQDLRSDDRASSVGTVIGTLLALGIIGMIAVDVLQALGRLSGA